MPEFGRLYVDQTLINSVIDYPPNVAEAIVKKAIAEAIDLVKSGHIKTKAEFVATVNDRILDVIHKALDLYNKEWRAYIEHFVEEIVEGDNSDARSDVR